MIKTTLFLPIFFLFTHIITRAQDSSYAESAITLQTTSGDIAGTLTLPKQSSSIPVALIIAGSGPTDRNGNSMLTKNDAYKMLAHLLAEEGIASVRYDKRGIGQSAKAMKSELELRFEDYINDAAGWIELLKKDKRFSTVTVIGHSEGSLIGMVAAKSAGADKYISIAGTGRPIDEVLKEQLKGASQDLYNLAIPVLDSLRQGHTVKKVDLKLFQFFRPSLQPYMISWLKYDPAKEIIKLKVPVMIVHGSKDLQVSAEDAKKLVLAMNGKADVLVVEKMNHVLKDIEGGREANAASYKDLTLPLSNSLESIPIFIKKK